MPRALCSKRPSNRQRRRAQLSKASVFAGKVQATVRLSDTTGIPEIPDADPNASPHGLAIKFTLGDGSEMDLVTHSFNGFPAATAADFDIFLKAVAASGPGAAKPTPIEKYLQAHPNAVPFVTQQNPPPESFATTTYFGVNAFAFVDASGKKTIVRYRFVPRGGRQVSRRGSRGVKGPELSHGRDRRAGRQGSRHVRLVRADRAARRQGRMTRRPPGRRIGNW